MDRITGMQLFVRTVETGSLSKAALDLGMTQPTVSKYLTSLEQGIGARLVNRNTRGLSLTDVGTLYYEKCKQILEQLDEADAIVRRSKEEVRGTLRINTSVAFGRSVVAPLVLGFMKQHPGLRVDLTFEDGYVDLVAQGVDLAIRMGRLADSSLGARYLGTNPWVMIASPVYLMQRGTPRTPADLETHNMLIYSTVLGDDRLHFVTPGAKSSTIAVHGNLRSNNLSTLLAAVRANLGIAAVPHYVAASSLADRHVVTVLDDHVLPAQEIHAVYTSPKQVANNVRTFIAFVEAFFRGEWWTGCQA